ncbi:hypothetical protein SDC9_199321 [bioreactor metagenome]|uniref:Type II secretion system protein GspF domain-containing protein n=1 Tax=bioreactor metagenome TaxID=1076179 RepID=A0A645ILF8_9ZZZZ
MDFLQINSELPLSKQYKHFFRTGIATGKTNQLLNKFQMLQETQLVRRIQAMARKLQIGIYLLIGLLVVMLYQLLLLPLRGLT